MVMVDRYLRAGEAAEFIPAASRSLVEIKR
jgi:hypothetical protein